MSGQSHDRRTATTSPSAHQAKQQAALVREKSALALPAAAQHALDWLRTIVRADKHLRTDSRQVGVGDGFLAYAVEGADNRPHIADAIARGAVAIVVEPLADIAAASSASPASAGAGGPADASSTRLDADGVGLPYAVTAEAMSAATPAMALPVRSLDVLAGAIASGWYGMPSAALAMIGVTGTNGKTTTTQWIATALAQRDLPTALIGTLGSGMPDRLTVTGFTTPNAAQFQQQLAQMRDEGAAAVAVEVSSHALHQGRVNGTAFDIAVFTNLTQDHLDYHKTFEAYEAAKARLFAWPGLRAAVINADDPAGVRLLATTSAPTLAYAVRTGEKAVERTANASSGTAKAATAAVASDVPIGSMGRLLALQPRATPSGGTALTIRYDDRTGQPRHSAAVEVDLIGDFNMANLLATLGAVLCVTSEAGTAVVDAGSVSFDGATFEAAIKTLTRLHPVLGRMQRLGGRAQHDEPLVVIDYAHTPDALEKTLASLRPVAAARGGALIAMFGCGGDRDTAKRPLMGAIAERLADAVVLTSDNPRSEAPAAIIDQIAAGMTSPVPDAARQEPLSLRRIDDRASAILQTVRAAQAADVVLLAGKGHEATQEIMGKKRPFSDQDHAQLALASRATHGRGDSTSHTGGESS